MIMYKRSWINTWPFFGTLKSVVLAILVWKHMLAFSDWNLMFIYSELLWKSWFPYFKQVTLRYILLKEPVSDCYCSFASYFLNFLTFNWFHFLNFSVFLHLLLEVSEKKMPISKESINLEISSINIFV